MTNRTTKSIVMVGAVTALFMGGCKPTLLTVAERNQYEEDFGTITKVQFYIDREIEIQRVTTDIKTNLELGEITTRKGVNYLTIVFPLELEGIARKESDGDERIFVLFDDDPKAFLTFKNYSDDNYYQLAGTNKSGKYYVSYVGFDDFEVLKGGDVRLLKKVSSSTKVKKKKQRAKGRSVK